MTYIISVQLKKKKPYYFEKKNVQRLCKSNQLEVEGGCYSPHVEENTETNAFKTRGKNEEKTPKSKIVNTAALLVR